MLQYERSMRVAGRVFRRHTRFILALCAVASFGFAVLPGASAHAAVLNLSHAWLRLTSPERPAAGYFAVTNDSDADRALVSASSHECGTVMLHQSEKVNGVAKMVMVKQIPVPAHSTARFAPNGYHIMCMKPWKDVMPGRELTIKLDFDDGAQIVGQFKVRGAGSE